MKINPHWHHAILTFFLTVLAAGFLLPLLRVEPEVVHDYFKGLNDWVRIVFIFSLCVIFTGASFKLLKPRIRQLDYWKCYPPAWLAAVLAWLVVAVVDLLGGFDSDGYSATLLEWIGFGGGSLLLVGCSCGLWAELVRWLHSKLDRWFCSKNTKEKQAAECITLQDIENAPWEEIEAWLNSNEPARYDFLGNQSVAHRVSLQVADGTQSVGIVGPFGSGKTSIVGWTKKRLKEREVGGRKYFVCHHSCWGFENSASAIQYMLRSAIASVSTRIDTFQVSSLPESYRHTFSAGGDWFEVIANLVLNTPKPFDQFSRLSNMLRGIDGHLIFIVEDLDRNETRNFEIQEVLAFLEQLKEHSNFVFILTGGLSSTHRIDYSKLCDHIEYLKTLQPHHSSRIIKKVCDRCWDNTVFGHFRFDDPNRNYEWNDLTDGILSSWREMSLPEAVAELLVTPRSLRHTLSNTYTCWNVLHGEIDLRHLIGVNVLRYAAPEALNFLIRHWIHLKQAPNSKIMPNTGESQLRERLREDWNQTIKGVDWDIRAALQVMHFLLPATECWLVSDNVSGMGNKVYQGVHEERYWRRAINGTVDNDDFRDQEVIGDIQAWKEAPGTANELVTKLTTLPRYADIWENLAGGFFANRRDDILLLCEQVTQRILLEQGSSACHDSQGFVHTWRFANRRVSNQSENRAWLQDRISEAAAVSIEMVNGLWHFYGNPGLHSILRLDDGEPVRQYVLNTLQREITDGAALITRLSENASATLYQLVFDPGNEGTMILADVQSWDWLGPHILGALRDRNVTAAANCGVLLGARVSGRERMTVDTEVLDQFFGEDATEVIDILESMIDRLPETDQSLVRNIVGAARQHLAAETQTDGQEDEANND
ncbi:MAG: hypothetical protein CMJ47_11100 [Planctomyces sp.]|nr:hypothetical protein [Planctomyces sp.]